MLNFSTAVQTNTQTDRQTVLVTISGFSGYSSHLLKHPHNKLSTLDGLAATTALQVALDLMNITLTHVWRLKHSSLICHQRQSSSIPITANANIKGINLQKADIHEHTVEISKIAKNYLDWCSNDLKMTLDLIPSYKNGLVPVFSFPLPLVCQDMGWALLKKVTPLDDNIACY